jgi:dTDP-4-amino-4,6-dideoxygalactose transaminase
MIYVTKPFLPPKEEYLEYIDGIWKRQWLTNNGPLVNELELQLKVYLNVPHLLYLSNGTVALQIAIKALGLTGEIITTPFSYVATTGSIVWENCKPIFVDIDKNTLNIDPAKIERAITPSTSAILATHVYGNPCDIDAIQKIASKNNLKVIYDAAHAFGTKYKGESIFKFGDIATASFHTTKLYHTIEGGAVFTQDPELLRVMAYMRNFGHIGDDYEYVGINAKNSEFHAAMGLLNLKSVDAILKRRQELWTYYKEKLKLLKYRSIELLQNSSFNFSYFPVVFENERFLLKAVKLLNDNWIYPRRYFHPSLSSLKYVERQDTPVADDICTRVICLPLYHDLRFEEIDLIARLLLRAQNY